MDADAGKGIAEVEYDPKVAKVEQLVEAVNKTGYKATAPEKDKKKDKEKEKKEDKEKEKKEDKEKEKKEDKASN